MHIRSPSCMYDGSRPSPPRFEIKAFHLKHELLYIYIARSFAGAGGRIFGFLLEDES